MLVIYSSEISPRLQYIVYNLPWKNEVLITYEKRMYSGHNGPKLNYSAQRIEEDEIWIKPHTILFETGISNQPYFTDTWKDLPVFFLTDCDTGFDFFAASFFLLTRYEEYLPFTPDKLGSYPHTESVAYKENFIQLPLINLWYQQLTEFITAKFDYTFKEPVFRFLPTYDVDVAFKYKGESTLRSMQRLGSALMKRDKTELKKITSVLTNKKDDPYDVFEWLDEVHDEHDLKPLYFILMAEENNAFDENVSPHKKVMKQLIAQLSSNYATGIHPSWQSNNNTQTLKTEISLLQQSTGKKVKYSRQHYLKMSMPETYNKLLRAGITDDYSMGYGSVNGFRASFCMPYKWYNLKKDEATSLCIHPFCFMDSATIFHERINTEEASMQLMHLYKTVQRVNGEMITISHNHLMTEENGFKKWRQLYNNFIEKISYKKQPAAAFESLAQ